MKSSLNLKVIFGHSKQLLSLLLLVNTIVCAILITSACTTKENENNNNINAVKSEEIMPLDLTIDSGNINNKTGLDVTYELNKSNGKYVNMYVENNGTNDIVATINGDSKKTFKPEDKGHIYVEVTQGFFYGDKEYVFKVHPGKNGGTVNIHYNIVQRDHQDV